MTHLSPQTRIDWDPSMPLYDRGGPKPRTVKPPWEQPLTMSKDSESDSPTTTTATVEELAPGLSGPGQKKKSKEETAATVAAATMVSNDFTPATFVAPGDAWKRPLQFSKDRP